MFSVALSKLITLCFATTAEIRCPKAPNFVGNAVSWLDQKVPRQQFNHFIGLAPHVPPNASLKPNFVASVAAILVWLQGWA
nr:hypothetical protein [Acidovorax sp.]